MLMDQESIQTLSYGLMLSLGKFTARRTFTESTVKRRRSLQKADFYIREGQNYGIGLIELTYSICNEIDNLNNMALDFGLLSTLPSGYYRSRIKYQSRDTQVEPGSLIPVEDPQSIFSQL